MMAQLGLNPAPARPVTTSKVAAPLVVIASGTPAELSNVDRLRAQMAAYNSHDAKGVDAYNAPDLVYHDMSMPADQTAKESLAATLTMFKAFPDVKLVPLSAWGAGSYVVVAGRFEGTNKGPMPAMGIKKPTGKAISARYLDIARWENGKIKEEWLFYDGLAMARQLGLNKK
jgi:predicted ester cyclase